MTIFQQPIYIIAARENMSLCLQYARKGGWLIDGYANYAHPLQARIRQHMTTIFGTDADSLDYATDGCSVPTYLLPLDVMALGFAKLGAGYFSTELNHAATRLRHAQAKAPFMVAGSERLDTQLLQAGQGRLQVKMGAEGVYLGAIQIEISGLLLNARTDHSGGRRR